MIIWIDAQLSPAIASWINLNFPVDAAALRDIGLRDAEDEEIFSAAKSAGVVVMTKDSDFLHIGQSWPATTSALADVRQHVKCSLETDSYCHIIRSNQPFGGW